MTERINKLQLVEYCRNNDHSNQKKFKTLCHYYKLDITKLYEFMYRCNKLGSNYYDRALQYVNFISAPYIFEDMSKLDSLLQ